MAEALQPLDPVAIVTWWRQLLSRTGATRWSIALALGYAELQRVALQGASARVPSDVYVQRGLSQWRRDADRTFSRVLTLGTNMRALAGETLPGLKEANVSALWLGIAVPLVYGGPHGIGVIGELAMLTNQLAPVLPRSTWDTILATLRAELGLSEGEDVAPGYDWAASLLSSAVAAFEEAAPGEAPTLRDKARRKVSEGFRRLTRAADEYGWLIWLGLGALGWAVFT